MNDNHISRSTTIKISVLEEEVKSKPMNDKRYNMREVAKELGVTRQTLYYWFKKGWVKPKRDYRNFPVFTKDDLKKIDEWKDRLK